MSTPSKVTLDAAALAFRTAKQTHGAGSQQAEAARLAFTELLREVASQRVAP
jgi:hypothetical protein